MNILTGQISSIETKDSLSLVKILVGATTLTTIIIDTPVSAPFLKVGTTVKALFKETEVVVGLDEQHAISIQNRLPGTIKDITYGDLLTKVSIQTETNSITAIITTQAVKELALTDGLSIQAMIKTNEIMLSE